MARGGGPSADRSPRAGLAIVAATLFAAFIFLNYITQTTFVPALAAHFRPELGVLIEALSMSNPRSMGWAVEMWGYGMLGIATWLSASAFSGAALERWAARTCVANGVISVAGGVMTAARLDWVFTTPGYVSFAAWNLLMLVLAGLTVAVWRRRLAIAGSGAPAR